MLRHLGVERDHAGDVGGVGRAGDVADDDLVDPRGIDLRALDRLAHGDASEFHRRKAGELGAGLDERSARPGHDDDVAIAVHGRPSFSLSIE